MYIFNEKRFRLKVNFYGGQGEGSPGGGGMSSPDVGGGTNYDGIQNDWEGINADINAVGGYSNTGAGNQGTSVQDDFAGINQDIGGALGGDDFYGGWEQASMPYSPQEPSLLSQMMGGVSVGPKSAFMMGTMMTGQPMVGALAAIATMLLGNAQGGTPDMAQWEDYYGREGGSGASWGFQNANGYGEFDPNDKDGYDEFTQSVMAGFGGGGGGSSTAGEVREGGTMAPATSPVSPELERYRYKDMLGEDNLAKELVFGEEEFTKSLF